MGEGGGAVGLGERDHLLQTSAGLDEDEFAGGRGGGRGEFVEQQVESELDEVGGVGGAQLGGFEREAGKGGLDLADQRTGGGGVELVEPAFEVEKPAAVGERALDRHFVAEGGVGGVGGGAEFAVPVGAELQSPASALAIGDGAGAGGEGGEFADAEAGGAAGVVDGHEAVPEKRITN